MSESNEKKQVATIWLLTGLIVILIAIIIGLIITVGKAKKAEIAKQSGKATQTVQELDVKEFNNNSNEKTSNPNEDTQTHENNANITTESNHTSGNNSSEIAITETTENDVVLTAQNNGGKFVKYGDNLYYWKLNEQSRESSALYGNYADNPDSINELIKRKPNGEETVLLKEKRKQ